MAEVVGVALAAIEFSVKILETYDKVRRGINTYCQYEKEVQRVLQRISVRQTRFREALLQLLTPYAGYDEASRMLNDQQHEAWHTEEFGQFLSQQLRDRVDGFQNGLRSIESDLNDIEKIANYCGFVIRRTSKHNEKAPELVNPKASIKSRIKYVFSQDEIKSLMISLKEDTDDFCELVNIIQPVAIGFAAASPSVSTKSKVRRSAMVKTAACALYNALGHACTKHTKHQVRLNLAAHCQHAAHVKFTVIFQHPDANPFRPLDGFDCHHEQQQFKLLINSTLDTTQSVIDTTFNKTESVIATINLCQKRSREQSPNPSTEFVPKRKKEVKFADDTVAKIQANCKPEVVTEMLNICENNNFCNDLRRCAIQFNCQNMPVGYMFCPSIYRDHRHMVSIATTNILKVNELSKLFALESQAISGMQQFGHREPVKYGRLQRVTMAKLLARALLQYNETPWLNDGWDTDHILFAGNDKPGDGSAGSKIVDEEETYLEVSLSKPQDTLSQPAAIDDNPSLVRNQSVFKLGVMMLEMAHGTSLKTAILPKDADPYYAANAEFHAATRLRQTVSSKVGSEYSEVIRKCIECDFGHGADMSKTGLQEAFYENVVQKLEDLERDLKNLTI